MRYVTSETHELRVFKGIVSWCVEAAHYNAQYLLFEGILGEIHIV